MLGEAAEAGTFLKAEEKNDLLGNFRKKLVFGPLADIG